MPIDVHAKTGTMPVSKWRDFFVVVVQMMQRPKRKTERVLNRNHGMTGNLRQGNVSLSRFSKWKRLSLPEDLPRVRLGL